MNKQFNFYLLSITLVATLGGLLFGYDTAVINGAINALDRFFIAPLESNVELAANVIMQVKLIIAICVFLCIALISSIFFKLLKRNLAILYSGGLALVVFGLVFFLLLNKENVYSAAIANTIKGFAISSALIGCVIGGGLGAYVSQQLGRKNGLLLAAMLFAISAIGSALPDKLNFMGIEVIGSFIFYRVIGGVGVGLASMLSPMYIAEIAPAKMRGQLISWNQFAIIFGMFVVSIVNFFIAKGQTEKWIMDIGWRYMFGSETIPAILFMLLLFVIPKSPRYLVMIEQEGKAKGVLNKIVGSARASVVIDEIKQSLKEKGAHWMKYGGTVIVIGILLSVFQQFVGINVVLYYSSEIFRNLGIDSTEKALIPVIIVNAILLSFTVLAIFTVDRFGRKPLMIIGSVFMAISMISLGFCFHVNHKGIGAFLSMMLYVAAFAMSWGPVTWVMVAEIFPNSIRGAMAIAVAAQWIANLIVSWTFPMMNDSVVLTEKFNHGFAYWIYGVMSIISIFFMWKFVPETKGKSLEEMEGLWKKK